MKRIFHTKESFLHSSEWKEFRHAIISRQKIDPVTKSKLVKKANLHHLCMDPNKYYDLSNEDAFIALNPNTHEIITAFWRMRNWRTGIDELTKLLEKMEKLSKNEK